MVNENPVEEYLSMFHKKVTRQQHKSHLDIFFRTLGIEHPESYFTLGRNYEKDLQTLWNSMEQHATGTRKMRFGIVLNFMLDNDIVIKPRTLNNIRTRTKDSEKKVHDTIPTKDELRQILSHGGAKERALFLISISSGMRIEEILKLLPKDISLKSNPVKVNVRAECAKNGKPRVTFISNEARDALNEWLKIRSNYLQTAQKRAANKNYNKDLNDERIFPVAYLTARLWWVRLLHDASTPDNNLAEKDKPSGLDRECYKRHIHTLRKYYRTYVPNSDNPISMDVIEQILGHEGYLTKEYRHLPESHLAKEYLKVMPIVTIFGDEKMIKDKDQQIADLQHQLQGAESSFKQQMEHMKKDIVSQVLDTLKNANPTEIMKLLGNKVEVDADGCTLW